jgi:hypothetical protein
VFEHVLESSRLPLPVPRPFMAVGVRVGSRRGCLARSSLGGDVFHCGLLIYSWCILGGEVVGAREGSGGDYLVGSAFHRGQTFLNGGLS